MVEAPAIADRAGSVPPRSVFAAAKRIRRCITHTPLEHSVVLSEHAGVDIHLKLECWQTTRSFKARGAFNALLSRDRLELERGVTTASAGNHGLAVAFAGRELGVEASVFVPSSAPAAKTRRIEDLGARLRTVEGSYDDAEAAAREYSADADVVLIHPFDDIDVAAGQGTVALEVLSDLPSVEQVVVPVGGGGLIAGVGTCVAAATGGGVRVLGVQSRRTSAMHAAFEAGRVVQTEVQPTLADGLAGAVSEASYRRAAAVTDELLLVEEESIADAMRLLYRSHGVVAEGSAAVGVAALLEGSLKPEGAAVVIITGGNVDDEVLAGILGNAEGNGTWPIS